MSLELFIQNAKEALKPILDQSGSLLYSSIETLKPGEFYVLGLNPGGTPSTEDETVGVCLDNLLDKKSNAYLDEDWSTDKKSYDQGNHPLQTHLKDLIESIHHQQSIDFRSVCCTNLIFTRSHDQDGSLYPHQAYRCWPVHQMMLQIVKPKVIIAFGNGPISPYDFLKRKHLEITNTTPQETLCKADHGKYYCASFRMKIDVDFPKNSGNMPIDVVILGLPHLSRYSIKNKERVIDWVNSRIREA